MKNNVIDIIQRFQTRDALQEERELKNFHAPGNGAVAPSIPDKTGMPENSNKNMDCNCSPPNESTRDVEFPTPHVERVVRTIRVRPPAASAAKSKESSLRIAAFFIDHPILTMLALWLMTLIGFVYIFALSAR